MSARARAAVDRLGEHLLADAGLAEEEHADVAGGDRDRRAGSSARIRASATTTSLGRPRGPGPCARPRARATSSVRLAAVARADAEPTRASMSRARECGLERALDRPARARGRRPAGPRARRARTTATRSSAGEQRRRAARRAAETSSPMTCMIANAAAAVALVFESRPRNIRACEYGAAGLAAADRRWTITVTEPSRIAWSIDDLGCVFGVEPAGRRPRCRSRSGCRRSVAADRGTASRGCARSRRRRCARRSPARGRSTTLTAVRQRLGRKNPVADDEQEQLIAAARAERRNRGV